MKKLLPIFLATLLVVLNVLPLTASAEEEKVIKLYTYDDLLQIKDNPSGSYELMADIDASGNVWTPVPFTGTFNGNGLSIMNLKIESLGTNTRTTIDGNWKEYDTYFAGFFETCENAEVKDLSILGIDIDVTTDKDSYIGGLAGFVADSTVTGCNVEGRLSLTTDCKSFGVGGIIGYGWGLLDNSTADVTLICIDENKTYKEEQFMGGAVANGYLDVTNCTINVNGYDSDHGYVHNGGLAGMYILPHGINYKGKITGNTVTGTIHFFEDNKNRRAYCVGLIGEPMNYTFENKDNDVKGFVRDETKDYSKNLLPETCENAEYETTVVAPTNMDYGYTLYECKTCDYSYKANYTSLRVYVEPETTTAAQEVAEEETEGFNLSDKLVPIIFAAFIIIAIIIAVILLNKKR